MSSAIRIRLRRGRSGRGVLGPAHGVLDQFGGGGEIEFLFNLFTVMLDGLDAEMKCARDLAGGLPLADQMQDLAFAIRETLQRGGFDGGLVAHLLLEQFGCHQFAQIDATGEHAADGRQDVAEWFGFHDVAFGSGPERQFGVNGLGVPTQDEYWQFGILRSDVFDQLQAVAGFKGQVHDGHVGRGGRDGPDRFGRVFDLCADRQVRLLCDELGDAQTHNRLVFDEQNFRLGFSRVRWTGWRL